jgi:hypothetical protein
MAGVSIGFRFAIIVRKVFYNRSRTVTNMPIITFNNKEYHARDGELLLDCLLRHGVTLDVDSACDDGACHRCKLREVSSAPVSKAASPLPEDLRTKGYVLPCATMVWHSLAVQDSASAEPVWPESVVLSP